MSPQYVNTIRDTHKEHAIATGTSMTERRNKGAPKLLSRLRQLPTVAILAVGLGGISASPAYAADPIVPFKGSFSGTVIPTSATTAVLNGAGYASHLGKTSYTGNVAGITATPTGIMDTLTETLTAANGDTLTILCQQSAEELSPGIYLGTDQWTVIGGTGNFSGATGSGSGSTYIDLNLSTYNKQLTGTISAGR